MSDYKNPHEALIALAGPEDREEYQRLYSLHIPTAFGGDTKKVSQELNRLSRKILPVLMEKLRNGDLTAHGFKYESGTPTVIDADLWQSLALHPMINMAIDNDPLFSGKNSRTGRFHTITFTLNKPEKERQSNVRRRAEISKIARFFERLDGELPSNATKADFFDHARTEFGPDLPDRAFRIAWGPPTKLSECRRKPGTKKSN